MDGWKMNFFLGMPIFRGYVSFREGTYSPENEQFDPQNRWLEDDPFLLKWSLFRGHASFFWVGSRTWLYCKWV